MEPGHMVEDDPQDKGSTENPPAMKPWKMPASLMINPEANWPPVGGTVEGTAAFLK